MGRVEKTVFISYRRTNFPWAVAIFQDLTQHGYDVFFDFKGISSGDFESVILENIRARAHFLVLLTPSALERCGDASDWLRREIETALDSRRNIVPLMIEGFDFSSPAIANQLTGTLSALRQYNALRIPADYFSEAMDRLRERFLNVSLDVVLHPASTFAQQVAEHHKADAQTAPAVQDRELTAQQWLEQGVAVAGKGDLQLALSYFNEAIRLHPSGVALFFRSGVRLTKGDLQGSLQDLDEAIRLAPNFAPAYHNRGMTQRQTGDIQNALRDLSEAIRLDPNSALYYHNRGLAYLDARNFDAALQDFSEAIRLKPEYAEAFLARGATHGFKLEWQAALDDLNRAIHLKADYFDAYIALGQCLGSIGDLDGQLRALNHAIALRPDNAESHLFRAIARKSNGDLDGALQDLSEAIRLKPNFPVALSLREAW
jgi:tetratricopeptide (TPR) repeat protein